MNDVAKSMAIRIGVYTVLVGYLALDVFFWRGPIYHSLKDKRRDEVKAIAEAKASGVVARVYYRPIYRAQVDEAMKEYLWRRGRTLADTTSQERKTMRLLIVNELIDDELVKLQIKVSMSEEVAVSDDKVAMALVAEKNRFPDEKVFEELARRAGWSGEKEREMRLAARIQRAEHLTRMVDITVNDEEVREWFEKNKEGFPGSFEESQEEIREALLIGKKDDAWATFRLAKLRRWAENKIDLFKDVLYED